MFSQSGHILVIIESQAPESYTLFLEETLFLEGKEGRRLSLTLDQLLALASQVSYTL